MNIEKEMNTADGLGAELSEVKKDKGFICKDDYGHNLEVGDEVHQDGYDLSEGRGVIASMDESDGYLLVTVHFHKEDMDEEFQAHVRWNDESAYILDEFELQ